MTPKELDHYYREGLASRADGVNPEWAARIRQGKFKPGELSALHTSVCLADNEMRRNHPRVQCKHCDQGFLPTPYTENYRDGRLCEAGIIHDREEVERQEAQRKFSDNLAAANEKYRQEQEKERARANSPEALEARKKAIEENRQYWEAVRENERIESRYVRTSEEISNHHQWLRSHIPESDPRVWSRDQLPPNQRLKGRMQDE